MWIGTRTGEPIAMNEGLGQMVLAGVRVADELVVELAEILTEVVGRLGMRLTADPRMVVITVTAVYQAMLEEAILGDLPDTGSNPYLDDMLPRLLELLVEPAEQN